MQVGKLEGIWLKTRPRGAMERRDRAELVVGVGLEGGVPRGGKRQVTVLSAESWQAAERELGVSLDPGMRRANLLVSGLALADTIGSVLALGDCRVLVWGETTPCRRMDEAYPGLRAALEPDWRGGVYGEVLEGGRIERGDVVGWERESF